MYLRGSPSPPTSICLVPQWINFTQSASNISQKENSYDVVSIELPGRKERVGYRSSPTTETPFNVGMGRLSESTLPSISINSSFGQSHVARAYELLHSLPVENIIRSASNISLKLKLSVEFLPRSRGRFHSP
uniref:Uncharacterized protein n=1 Tax=Vespula pensylvanica TaxID=30213 RepID=A0A834UEA4_VESPE|nr:hypothetical protein H0235_002568 [Vespula pensylvanica]